MSRAMKHAVFLLRVDLNNLPCNIDGKTAPTQKKKRKNGREARRPVGWDFCLP